MHTVYSPGYFRHYYLFVSFTYLKFTDLLKNKISLLKIFVHYFIRWDEDTIELAQMWKPKDISKAKTSVNSL